MCMSPPGSVTCSLTSSVDDHVTCSLLNTNEHDLMKVLADLIGHTLGSEHKEAVFMNIWYTISSIIRWCRSRRTGHSRLAKTNTRVVLPESVPNVTVTNTAMRGSGGVRWWDWLKEGTMARDVDLVWGCG